MPRPKLKFKPRPKLKPRSKLKPRPRPKPKLKSKLTPRSKLKGRVGLTEKYVFHYAKQYITPHLITEKHENDNEKILKPHLHA